MIEQITLKCSNTAMLAIYIIAMCHEIVVCLLSDNISKLFISFSYVGLNYPLTSLRFTKF